MKNDIVPWLGRGLNSGKTGIISGMLTSFSIQTSGVYAAIFWPVVMLLDLLLIGFMSKLAKYICEDEDTTSKRTFIELMTGSAKACALSLLLTCLLLSDFISPSYEKAAIGATFLVDMFINNFIYNRFKDHKQILPIIDPGQNHEGGRITNILTPDYGTTSTTIQPGS